MDYRKMAEDVASTGKDIAIDLAGTTKNKITDLYKYIDSLEEEKKKRLCIIAGVTVLVIAVACIFYNMGKKSGRLIAFEDEDWDD